MTTTTDNEQRASRGWEAISWYANRQGYDTRNDDDHEGAASDLIADVLHAVETFTGWKTEDVHARAWRHFIAELAEEGSEPR